MTYDLRVTVRKRPGRYFLPSGTRAESYYVNRQLLLDAFYPALIALTLTSLFQLVGNKLSQVWLVKAGIAVSWMAAGFDYAENAGIYAMLSMRDDLPDLLVHLTAFATVSKSALTSLAILGLAGLCVGRWWARSKVAGKLS